MSLYRKVNCGWGSEVSRPTSRHHRLCCKAVHTLESKDRFTAELHSESPEGSSISIRVSLCNERKECSNSDSLPVQNASHEPHLR
jgi:hypothetical protein